MKQGFFDYGDFVKKFKPSKTTDDCYTPENVFRVIVEYVRERYGIEERQIMRPFFPGGNYETFDYPEDCAVVDNPPFSIEAKICRFYAENGIRFFLFCPGLVMSQLKGSEKFTVVCAAANIVYENGAEVRTNFVTNMEPDIFIRSDPALHKRLEEANKINRKKDKKKLPKLSFPDAVITTAKMNWLAEHDTEFEVRRCDGIVTHALDNYGSVFGYGILLSERAAAERAAAERAAAERAAAERAAAERAAATKINLSEREREIQRRIGR